MQQFLRIFQQQQAQSPSSSTSSSPASSPPRSRKSDGQKRHKKAGSDPPLPLPPLSPTPSIATTATTATTAAAAVAGATALPAPSMAAIVTQSPAAPASKPYYVLKGLETKQDATQVGPNKKAAVRQNIDDWSDNPDNQMQVDLFVMAWYRLMQVDPHDRDSFFQIAGIHGQPNVIYDENISEDEIKDKGYCTHNNILFPIWHRPYLLLLEQQLHDQMVNKIIPGFPADQQAVWKEAADSWRLPFWDWGRKGRVPKLAKTPTTVVPKADLSGHERIDNPLFQFKMPNGLPMSSEKVQEFKDPWIPDGKGAVLHYGDCIGTSRWPDEDDIQQGSEMWKHGVVNNGQVEFGFKRGFQPGPHAFNGTVAEMVYRLLTVPLDYATFATTAQLDKNESVANDLNIEGLHNLIHGMVGGDFNGHMSQIPVATFDPLFWLHHCNIDRIFAMWQALNPDKWFTSSTVNEFFQSIVGLPVGATITPQTPLRPFHKEADGAYWLPGDARSTYEMGYTYPELQTWETKYQNNGAFDREIFIKQLNTYINDTYGLSRTMVLDSLQKIGGTEAVDGGMKLLDWGFSVRYRKYAFGGEPFWIRIYLSQDEGKQNPTMDMIASVYNFSQAPEKNGKVNCANCKRDEAANTKATYYISLTPILVQLIKDKKSLPSLKREDVLEYIRKRAYWRVFRNGVQVESYDVEKVELEIIGSNNDSTQYDDPAKLPVIENFKSEPTITGGGEGALDDKLKQPVVAPPPPKPDIPEGNLKVGETLPFKTPLAKDAVVIVESNKLDLTAGTAEGIDNSQVSFLTEDKGSDILFLMSVRRKENQIVFNHKLGGSWGREVRISLPNRFKESGKTTIMVHDEGDGYEVMIDWVHACWYEKPDKTKIAKAISYGVNKPHKPVFSNSLNIRVFPSLSKLFASTGS